LEFPGDWTRPRGTDVSLISLNLNDGQKHKIKMTFSNVMKKAVAVAALLAFAALAAVRLGLNEVCTVFE
jgi:hypothetical protein